MSIDPRPLSNAEMRQLVFAFHQAALFLIKRIENDGWQWSSNFLREYARAATGIAFSNSHSPEILRRLRNERPELEKWIVLGVRTKGPPQGRLFR